MMHLEDTSKENVTVLKKMGKMVKKEQTAYIPSH
jgi:hypothetical protein